VTATILLIRHAAHMELGSALSGRRRNVALSPDGLKQAAILGHLLGPTPIAAVYSSPLQRAWHTARDVAAPHELEPVIADGLEEVNFGAWTGRSFIDLEGDPRWKLWNERRGEARAPDGESMAEAVRRAAAELASLAAAHNGETIVAVSHCDIIRGVVALHLGLPLDNLLRFDVDPASLTRLAADGEGARIVSVNERLHP
jgi:broad specificity phosphatase PhoE